MRFLFILLGAFLGAFGLLGVIVGLFFSAELVVRMIALTAATLAVLALFTACIVFGMHAGNVVYEFFFGAEDAE